MFARVPSAGVLAAVLLSATCCLTSAAAKPPDLPNNPQVDCANDALAPSSVAEDYDVHAYADLCATVRNMQRCLLFSANPLLVLVPMNDWADDIAVTVAESRAGSLLFGVGVNSDAGLRGSVVQADSPSCPYLRQQRDMKQPATACSDAPQVDDALGNLHKLQEAGRAFRQAEFFRRTGHAISARFFYDLVHRLCPGSHYDQLANERCAEMLAAQVVGRKDNAGSEEQEPPTRKSDTRCPCLQGGEGQKSATVPDNACDVLDNLNKLEHAAQVYRLAEAYRRQGRLDDARGCYDSIRRLCPGSHWSQLASEGLEQLPARVEADEKSAEKPASQRLEMRMYPVMDLLVRVNDEQAPQVALVHCLTNTIHPESWASNGGPAKIEFYPVSRALVVIQTADVHEQIADLLAALRRLHGHLPSSAPSVEKKAVALLDACHRAYASGRLAEDPDNPMAQAALRIAAMQQAMYVKPTKSSCPAATPVCPMRRPELPAVDANVVGAMETVLKQVGEADEGKLTVTVEEGGTTEDQEPPTTEKETPPVLLPDTESDQALGDFLDGLRSAACVDVDVQPSGSRGRWEVQLGFTKAVFSWDERNGHGSFTLGVGVPWFDESKK